MQGLCRSCSTKYNHVNCLYIYCKRLITFATLQPMFHRRAKQDSRYRRRASWLRSREMKLVQRYNSAAAEFSINNDPNNNATSKFRFRARHDRFAKSRATRYWHSIYSTLLKLSGRLINLSKLNSFSDFANGNLLLSDEHNAIGIHARRDARNNNIISEVIRQKRPTIAWNRTSRFWRHENL
jgi:hypothetical protein